MHEVLLLDGEVAGDEGEAVEEGVVRVVVEVGQDCELKQRYQEEEVGVGGTDEVDYCYALEQPSLASAETSQVCVLPHYLNNGAQTHYNTILIITMPKQTKRRPNSPQTPL